MLINVRCKKSKTDANYIKREDTYCVSIITGPSHVLLGLRFGELKKDFPMFVCKPAVGSSKFSPLDETEILKSVLQGVGNANKQYNSTLSVTEIEYIENDTPDYDTYSKCAFLIAEGVINKHKFKQL